jgi:hypothetical protein
MFDGFQYALFLCFPSVVWVLNDTPDLKEPVLFGDMPDSRVRQRKYKINIEYFLLLGPESMEMFKNY